MNEVMNVENLHLSTIIVKMLHNSYYVHCVTFDVANIYATLGLLLYTTVTLFMTINWIYIFILSEWIFICVNIFPRIPFLNIKIDMKSIMYQFTIFKLFMLHIRVFFKYTVTILNSLVWHEYPLHDPMILIANSSGMCLHHACKLYSLQCNYWFTNKAFVRRMRFWSTFLASI